MHKIFPVAFNLGDLPISWRGLILAMALLCAILLAVRDEGWMGLAKGTVLQLAAITLPIAFIASRLFFVVFAWDRFAEDPVQVFHLWDGGFALYGAIIAGLICIAVYARIKKIDRGRLMELFAAPLMLGIAIGRWGDLINLECYGPAISSVSLQRFPLAFYHNGLDEWRFALFFLESMICLLILCFLMYKRAELKKRGDAMSMALLFYGIARTFIESLREDSLYLGFVRISEVCSMLMVLSIIGLFFRRAERLNKNKSEAIITFSILVLCLGAVFVCEFFMAQENWIVNHCIIAAGLLGIAIISMYIYRHCDNNFYQNGDSFTKREIDDFKNDNVA